MVLQTKHDVMYLDPQRRVASILLDADTRVVTISMADGKDYELIVTGRAEARIICDVVNRHQNPTPPLTVVNTTREPSCP